MNQYRFEIPARVRFTIEADSVNEAVAIAATTLECAGGEDLPVDFDALTETTRDHNYEGLAYLDDVAQCDLHRFIVHTEEGGES